MARASPTASSRKRSAAGKSRRPAGAARPAPGEEIARLRREHRNFHRLVRLFQSQLAVFHAGGEPDYGVMRDVMQYLVQFSDRFHHPREDLIFERLVRADPASAHAIEGILREHEDMAARATELLAALEQIAADALVARETLEAMARDYLAELGTHIEKEENVLFPLALRHLKAKDWAAIAAQSRRYEDPLFGASVAPGYRALFQRLAETTA